MSCSCVYAYSGLKRGTLGGRSPEALALLNPQLPLLVRALGSRSAAVVSLALRVLASLIQLPLKGVQQDLALKSRSSTCSCSSCAARCWQHWPQVLLKLFPKQSSQHDATPGQSALPAGTVAMAAAVSCSIRSYPRWSGSFGDTRQPRLGADTDDGLEVDYMIHLSLSNAADTLARLATPVAYRRADILRAGGWKGSHGVAEQAAERDQPARSGRLQAAGMHLATIRNIFSCGELC